jgi:hypothetical protein
MEGEDPNRSAVSPWALLYVDDNLVSVLSAPNSKALESILPLKARIRAIFHFAVRQFLASHALFSLFISYDSGNSLGNYFDSKFYQRTSLYGLGSVFVIASWFLALSVFSLVLLRLLVRKAQKVRARTIGSALLAFGAICLGLLVIFSGLGGSPNTYLIMGITSLVGGVTYTVLFARSLFKRAVGAK